MTCYNAKKETVVNYKHRYLTQGHFEEHLFCKALMQIILLIEYPKIQLGAGKL